MEGLSAVLPIVIYLLLIVLLIVTIVLAVKLIITIDKINNVVEDVKMKISSLDTVFNVVALASDKMTYLTSKVFDIVKEFINKIFIGKEDEDGK